MNIYAASDLHGNLPVVPEDADVLLLAGDICPDFRPYGNRGGLVDKGGQRQADWLNTAFRFWLRPLVERGVRVVATWGNHDFVGERSYLYHNLDLPWDLLVDGGVDVGGLNVYGTPWVPGLPYWAFYGDERRLKMRADAIPEGVDILMTHGPPRGVGDYIPTSEIQRNKYGNHGGMHVGDETLNDAMARVRPRAIICGHIHEARGMYNVHYGPSMPSIGELDEMPPLEGFPRPATVHNVAAVNENYVLHPDPWSRIYL